MSVRVKICGVTRLEDAQAAVEAGADALGFMFYERSPRRVSVAVGAAICRQLPPFVSKVGVFVDAAIEVIEEAVVQCGLDVVQLHGGESPAFCGRLSRPVIKAVRVRGPETLAELAGYATAAWLLDAYVPGQRGGTGATFDWGLATQAVGLGRPVILAGGLTAANVAAAVRQVRPYAVDVSSGVESEPGRKDAAAIEAFVRAAKAV
ncbi:MAG: phosphoribosylanthranilate isomerase [Verrucomicrobia bacterium]|nr:phosphoribosylanthranilate isomerase [Verrucomicrobiota bacterium]